MLFILLTAPVPTSSQLQLPSAEKPTGTALPIRGTALNGGTGTELSHSIPVTCVAEEAELTNSNVEGGKKEGATERMQSMPDRGDEAKMEPSKDDRLPQLATKDADKESEEAAKEVHRTATSLKREKSPEEKASTTEESEASSSPSTAVNDQSYSETVKQVEIQTRLNERHPSEIDDLDEKKPSAADEVHPEERAKPSVGFAEPQASSRPASETITPAVSPDEEESPALSGRPRTLSFISEKYAGLLGHSYRPGSTSSSSDLLESPLYVARKRLLNQSE